jgi:hypothetical protein
MMREIEIDFYSGFDDDTEIIFSIETDEYRKKLSIWCFYFEQIMDKIEREDDEWTDIAYYYHFMIGWDREENWRIPNLDAALLQFKSIKLIPDYRVNQMHYNAKCRILAEIIEILSEAIEKKVDVYIIKIT